MAFKAVIFDLDGTLVNSIEDLADAMNTSLSNYDFPTHGYDAYQGFIGNGIKSLVTKALPETNRDDQQIKRSFAGMMDIYSSNCTNKTKPYDGIIEMLDALKSREIKLCVLSNKEDSFAKEVASALLPNYFESVDGLTIEAHKKPNPIKAIEMSKNLGLKPEDILYVGDTDIDMQTANNANMFAVGVSWGFRSKDVLIANGAKLVIDHPLDLIAIL
ncbi:HAD family hydrolase [Algibacter agarivorans]|uniref:phosphoglycolate phosphatase n=1 Tax=Algibacter agarivorans TaxID=1109741 RepID=A0ABP9GSY2_9FLAO